MNFTQADVVQSGSDEYVYNKSLTTENCYQYQTMCHYLQCQQEMNSAEEHNEHLERFHSQPDQQHTYNCDVCCDVPFRGFVKMLPHLTKQHGLIPAWKCIAKTSNGSLCQVVFGEKKTLFNHLRNIHNVNIYARKQRSTVK